MRSETKAIYIASILGSLAVGLNAAPGGGPRVAHGPGAAPGNHGHQNVQPYQNQNGGPPGLPSRSGPNDPRNQQGAERRQGHQPSTDGAASSAGSQGQRPHPGQAGQNSEGQAQRPDQSQAGQNGYTQNNGGAVRPPGSPGSGAYTPIVNQRTERQEARTEAGIRSGQLTGREVFRLQREEGKIRAERQTALADGKVTPQERKELNRDLNKLSRDIEKQKHDGDRRLPPTPPTLPPAPGSLPPTPSSTPPTPSAEPSVPPSAPSPE